MNEGNQFHSILLYFFFSVYTTTYCNFLFEKDIKKIPIKERLILLINLSMMMGGIAILIQKRLSRNQKLRVVPKFHERWKKHPQ